jgi:FixJ family two-component response regulator
VTVIRKGIVAIVDDDAGMRKAMSGLLSAFGYASQTFESAEAFLRAAADSKANCLVIDVQLGDLSGIVLASRLAEAGLKFPIIFMSAADDPEILRQVTRLDAITCLRKPFSAQRLIESVVKAIG